MEPGLSNEQLAMIGLVIALLAVIAEALHGFKASKRVWIIYVITVACVMVAFFLAIMRGQNNVPPFGKKLGGICTQTTY